MCVRTNSRQAQTYLTCLLATISETSAAVSAAVAASAAEATTKASAAEATKASAAVISAAEVWVGVGEGRGDEGREDRHHHRRHEPQQTHPCCSVVLTEKVLNPHWCRAGPPPPFNLFFLSFDRSLLVQAGLPHILHITSHTNNVLVVHKPPP